jgi:hypothetical protein
MWIYLFFMFLSFTALCLFDWPYIPNKALVAATLAMFVVTNILYVLVSKSDPGYVQNN